MRLQVMFARAIRKAAPAGIALATVPVATLLAPRAEIALATVAVAAPPGRATDLPLPDRSFLTESEHALGAALPADLQREWPRPDAAYGYDVDHVHLELQPDFAFHTIEARTVLTVTITEADLTSISVDLDDDLAVTAADLNGSSTSYLQGSDQVVLQLGIPPEVGSQLEVGISYGGHPAEVGNKSMRWATHSGAALMYTLSTPYSTPSQTVLPVSHYWRPCKDVPDDKSTYSAALTVPGTMIGVSCGLLTGTVDNGDGTTTYTWEHDYPVAPYLITVGITNYVEIQDEYAGDGGSSPIRHYAFPEDLADATSDWAVTVPQMALFAGKFGEYPFLGDKFGNYETAGGPAVEHQTAVSTPQSVVNGLGTYDWLNAHELAHMWFGDCLTVADWDHVWLSEGAASYAEAVWREEQGGPEALRAYMLNMDIGPYAGTVFAPPYVWSSIVYDKGAWILHMLRHILGDSVFFQMVQDYRAAHAYGNVVTDDLVSAAEVAYGGDMDWFFDPWVYREGRPDYTYDWSASPRPGGGFLLNLYVEQSQTTDFPTYRMPIDVAITTASGTETTVVTNALRTEAFAIQIAEMPIEVSLDPDDWILADFSRGAISAFEPASEPASRRTTSLAQNRPNPVPSGAGTEIRFTLSRPSAVALRVFDVTGRLIQTLARGAHTAGDHAVIWDSRDAQGQVVADGAYFYQLVGPDGVEERRLVVVR